MDSPQPQISLPKSDQAPTGKDIDEVGPRTDLYTHEFADDPHGAYTAMIERSGPLAPVWIAPNIPATLVTRHGTAVRILNAPDERFSADPRGWEKAVPSGCPVLPTMRWRPNALRNDTDTHKRHRQATSDALAGINMHALREKVKKTAHALIQSFCADGAAELMQSYINSVVFVALNTIVGSTEDIGSRIADASAELVQAEDAETADSRLNETLTDLVELRRREPGDDVTTRLINHHAGLSTDELVHALAIMCGMGAETTRNLVANTLLRILTDPSYTGGGLLARDHVPPTTDAALSETLANDPPLANYCITYPRQPIEIDGIWLPADQPVITSMAACSLREDPDKGARHDAGWFLAWGLGPHACPQSARDAALFICRDTIDYLLDALPDMRLAVAPQDLEWRPGPFYRALAALPVVFLPDPHLREMQID